MADFWDKLIGSIAGTSIRPQVDLTPVSQGLNEAYGAFQGSLPAYLAGQRDLATGQANIGMGVANQLDPNILSNYTGANKYFNDQLQLGSNFDPNLTAEITRQLLSSRNAVSGFGASPGGMGDTFYQTALQKQARADQNARNSLAAGSGGIGIAQSLYQPTAPIGAAPILQMQYETKAKENDLANLNASLDAQDFAKYMGAGARIFGSVVGGVVGAYTGNPVGGVQAGGAIGASLFPGQTVAGYGGNNQTQSQQSNPFSSLLGLFGGGGGIGGPRYGIGAGQNYAGGNGNVLTSIRASPVNV